MAEDAKTDALERLKALQDARAAVSSIPVTEQLQMLHAILTGIGPTIADLEVLADGVRGAPNGAILAQQCKNIGMSRNNALAMIEAALQAEAKKAD